MSQTSHDVVILGGGSGGYAAALRAAQLGLTVALVEEAELGGTCLHRGCIPTKALLHAAEVAEVTRAAGSVGVTASFGGVDLHRVNAYKDGVVGRLHRGLESLVEARDVNLVRGRGRLVSPTDVQVGTDVHHATRAIVLATGSRPRTLSGIEVSGRIISSDQALEMDQLPSSVVVLGGGVIGVEFASLWRSFGVEVTVVEALPRLVPNEDVASSKALERAFRRRGIKAMTGVSVSGVEQDDHEVTLSLDSNQELQAELLLVAVGRTPNTCDIGFEQVGVETRSGYVATDERLRTSVPGIFAVGDIVPGLQLAHRGFQHGILVAEQIAGLDPTPVQEAGIPRVVYSEPEIASVGLTEEQAVERLGQEGMESTEYNLAGNGKSQILGTTGFIKLVRAKGGPVVGVHMVGSRVGELVGEAQLIVSQGSQPEELARFVHAHPTQNEAFGEALLALVGKPLHSHA